MSAARAAEILNVRRARLLDLVNGIAGLSSEMALRIEKVFGVNMDMLMRMQAYDSYTMPQKAGERDAYEGEGGMAPPEIVAHRRPEKAGFCCSG